MDTVLHRIEALPGEGRYAVTFRRSDGGEQSAVAQITGTGIEIAESALPAGWHRESDLFRGTSAAVRALDAARHLVPSSAALCDVDGGWDVGLGNVVLRISGVPECTAHGDLTDQGGVWVCADCGARALLA